MPEKIHATNWVTITAQRPTFLCNYVIVYLIDLSAI